MTVYIIASGIKEWKYLHDPEASIRSYVHLVFRAEDYLYSSAADYAGENGFLDGVIVVK